MTVITTTLLDTATGEMIIDPNFGTAYKNGMATDKNAIKQLIETRLQTCYGEWYLDITTGLDYFGVIFNRKAPRDLVDSAIKNVILQTQGVVGITGYFSVIDPIKAILTVYIKNVQTDLGTITNLTIPLGA